MPTSPARRAFIALVAALPLLAAFEPSSGPPLRFAITLPSALAGAPLDGRLLLLLSTDDRKEPRFQISDTDVPRSQQVFGADVEALRPGQEAVIDGSALGYPL